MNEHTTTPDAPYQRAVKAFVRHVQRCTTCAHAGTDSELCGHGGVLKTSARHLLPQANPYPKGYLDEADQYDY